MHTIGGPMSIQKTDDGNWIVRLETGAGGTAGEQVSFAVAVKFDPNATLADIERRAVERATTLLQRWRAQLAE